MRVALLPLAVLFAVGFSVSGCRSAAPIYQAQTLDASTVVDGSVREWPQALRPVPAEAGLGIGLRRDADALVVVVVASDERQARRIALGGLRVWIDPAGGRERALGIQFPAPGPLDDRTLGMGRPSGATAMDALRRRFESSLDAVEITRGESAPQRMDAGSVAGLETAATWTAAGLVVEMRVPLAAQPGLLAERAGAAVGVGVELVDLPQAAVRRSRRADPRPDGPERGERPLDREEVAERVRERLSAASIDTVTRWLRID